MGRRGQDANARGLVEVQGEVQGKFDEDEAALEEAADEMDSPAALLPDSAKRLAERRVRAGRSAEPGICGRIICYLFGS